METNIILYHGSNYRFEETDLSKSKDRRDFDRGFYTTRTLVRAIWEQAEDWAKALFDRYRGDGIFTYEIEFDFSEP